MGTDAAVRNAVSITMPSSAEEVYYEASKDELALFVQPITGAVITGYERLQTNWYIEKSMVDSSRYANVFSAESDNNDVFVWPFMYIKKEPAITESGASQFKELVYGAYDNGFHLSLLGGIMCLICAISAAICCKVDTVKALAVRPQRRRPRRRCELRSVAGRCPGQVIPEFVRELNSSVSARPCCELVPRAQLRHHEIGVSHPSVGSCVKVLTTVCSGFRCIGE